MKNLIHEFDRRRHVNEFCRLSFIDNQCHVSIFLHAFYNLRRISRQHAAKKFTFGLADRPTNVSLDQLEPSFQNAAMKQCPQCSTEYDDGVNFCFKDGRSLAPKTTMKTRLCPYCANSVDEAATNCPYCKGDLQSESVPQWLRREDEASHRSAAEVHQKRSVPQKFIWIAAIVIVAVAAFSAGGYIQRNQLLASMQGNLKELKAKDQVIQSSETQIQNLQAQLAQARQELSESSSQVSGAKAKLEQSQKDLAVSQQRLGVATHEIERLNARAQAPTRVAARSPDPTPPPVRSAQRTQDSLPQPSPSRQANSGDNGVYETTRATTVYQNPSSAARVVSEIAKGTRINVVSNSGGWLEVHSRRGNPPGYVRADDARYVGRVN
jgi:hypothetical protein